ncbi:uncharacterized protein METZ01_LOCUS101886, partial [marine metagenome]
MRLWTPALALLGRGLHETLTGPA